MQPFELISTEELEAIHQTTLLILEEVGVRISHSGAQEVLKNHGCRTEGELVFFPEPVVSTALKNAPATFTLHARKQENSVDIGTGNLILTPGYGAPFLIDPQKGKQIPTLEDYRKIVKLNQMLPNQDLIGYLMVEPQDLPPDTAHLHLLQSALVDGDKPLVGSAVSQQAAEDTLALLRICFGANLEQPAALGVISALSPLSYSPDMIEAVLVYAQGGQPLLFANLVMAGSTGPITLPGMIAQQNAELLAGITLAQCIQPGLPVIYGTTSTNIDMRSGSLAIGSPELSLTAAVHAQLARFYELPSRAGGALTDSSTADIQAGWESMQGMLTAAVCGIDFVLHAGGILSSYLAFSVEKLILDDEICGMMKRIRQGVSVTPETLSFPIIQNVGPGGHFLSQPQTLERCRTEFWQPAVADRSGMESYWSGDQEPPVEKAAARSQDLLANYQKPTPDRLIEDQIKRYIKERTG